MTRRSSGGGPRGGTARDYPRTARLNHLVHEIVAEEIERIDDDRLGLLTVVGVEVEPDIRHATVWYTALPVDSRVAEQPVAAWAEGGATARLSAGFEELRWFEMPDVCLG